MNSSIVPPVSLPLRQGGTLVAHGEVAFTVTMRQILERLIIEADNQIVATLELDSAEWDEYFQRPSLRRYETTNPPE